VTQDTDCSKDIQTSTEKAPGTMAGFSMIWNSTGINIETESKVLDMCVMSVLIHATDPWTSNKKEKKKRTNCNKCSR